LRIFLRAIESLPSPANPRREKRAWHQAYTVAIFQVSKRAFLRDTESHKPNDPHRSIRLRLHVYV